jgi:GxxExxY protein
MSRRRCEQTRAVHLWLAFARTFSRSFHAAAPRRRTLMIAIAAYSPLFYVEIFAIRIARFRENVRKFDRIALCTKGGMSVTPIRPGFDDPQTYAINGAGMAVHRELGRGFLESVYQAALEIELRLRAIPFKREVHLPVRYRDHLLSVYFKADFVCFDRVIVEVKALDAIGPIEQAQAINYLKVTGFERAVILNFGTPSLQHRRIVQNLKNDPVKR